jgi:hypothetical protein
MNSSYEILKVVAALWLLMGLVVASGVVVGCASNVTATLLTVIGNAVRFSLLVALCALVLVWTVFTGPFWIMVIAFKEIPAARAEDKGFFDA